MEAFAFRARHGWNGMRIVFGLISSHENAQVLSQLVDTLAPHRVVLHHDPTREPLTDLRCANLLQVPDAQPTGWGTWSFVQAILRTLRFARERHDFDYFQLLSPSCLPIRPLADFRHHVMHDRADIHADLMPVDADDDTLMTFGYRTYLPGGGLRFRLLRHVRGWYFGPHADLIQQQSLSLHRHNQHPLLTPRALGGHVALALTHLAARGLLGAHPYGPTLQPRIGSIWFGARRTAVDRLLQMSQTEPWRSGFRRYHLLDEALLPTLLAQTGCSIHPSNHVISPFDERGHPQTIGVEDMPGFEASGRFFARKFSLNADDAARRLALEWACGVDAAAHATTHATTHPVNQGEPIGTPRLSIQPM